MITTRILTYVCAGFLAIILALGFYLHVVKLERDGYKGAVAGFKVAQQTNLGTIADLQKDLVAFKGQNAADVAQGKKDAASAQKSIDARNAKTTQSQTKRDAYYAKQPASDCGNQLIPDGLLDGLR